MYLFKYFLHILVHVFYYLIGCHRTYELKCRLLLLSAMSNLLRYLCKASLQIKQSAERRERSRTGKERTN